MQRTAVIYGLALATLVGAFMLVPRLKTPPPPPPRPDPIPQPTATPITDLVYSDGTVEVHARLDRGYLSSSSGEALFMDLAIQANGVQTKAPLTTMLVIDRSGSMAGDKIEDARNAAARFVRGLRDGDQLGIVTFGTDVTMDLPITTLDSTTRNRALNVVRNIEEGGGTNIDGGLMAAKSALAKVDLSGRIGRVILVSDGRPTEGDRRETTLVAHATKLRDAATTTSTIGVGLDYNEDLMEHIALEGGGRYHYMKTGAELAKILDDELQHGTAVVASGVKVYLPRELGGFTVEGAPGSKATLNERIAIDVGDLAAGETRHVLIKLAVNNPADVAAIAAPELTYKKAGESSESLVAHRADAFRVIRTTDVAMVENSRNSDVRVRVLQIEASLALTESMSAYASGDSAGARQRLSAKKDELKAYAAKTKNASLAAEADNFESVLGTVTAAPAPATEKAQDMIKAQKARAFELRR
jgi:Ca-activated chloride channel family protein